MEQHPSQYVGTGKEWGEFILIRVIMAIRMSDESVYLYRALRAVRVRVRHRRRPSRDARVVPTTGVEPGGERVYFNFRVGNS